jgi:hypothetical protein
MSMYHLPCTTYFTKDLSDAYPHAHGYLGVPELHSSDLKSSPECDVAIIDLVDHFELSDPVWTKVLCMIKVVRGDLFRSSDGFSSESVQTCTSRMGHNCIDLRTVASNVGVFSRLPLAEKIGERCFTHSLFPADVVDQDNKPRDEN